MSDDVKMQVPKLVVSEPISDKPLESLLTMLFTAMYRLSAGGFEKISLVVTRQYSLNGEGIPTASTLEPKGSISNKDGTSVSFIDFDASAYPLLIDVVAKLEGQAMAGMLKNNASEIDAKKLSFIKSITFSLNGDMRTEVANIIYFSPEVGKANFRVPSETKVAMPEWVKVTFQKYDKEYDKAVLTDEAGMRYILSLKHAEDEAWIFEEEGPLFGEMNDVQHNGEDAVKNRGFELVTLDGVYHFSFTNPYKVNMKVLMNMAEVDPMELLKIVPDETAIPNLKKVKVSTQKFGELTVVLSENQTKLVNFAFHPEAELQGLYPSKKEIETLNDFAIKKYKMRAVIYSEQWSTEESNRFVEAAKAYTSGQFFTEMFHYGFLELASGKGVVMFEDPNLNKSLAGSLEDRITSTIGSVCS